MKDFRFEIKFVLKSIQVDEALKWLYFNTSAKKSFPNRIVNSIYFDNLSQESVKDNLSGISQRSKYRLRWYGDQHARETKKSIFEIKQKNNKLGSKQRFDFINRNPLTSSTFSELMQDLKHSNIHDVCNLSALHPLIHVQYKRNYFEGFQGVRVTIDTDIKYFAASNEIRIGSSTPMNYPHTIMELKFDPNQHDIVSHSLKKFHLVPCRHSKYLTGMSMLGNVIYI